MSLRGGAYLAGGQRGRPPSRTSATAIDLTPRNVAAYAARGFAYAKAEAYDDALNDFARAIELEPRSPKAFAYRAWTYRQQQPELALKDVERALKLDASSAEAYWARGEIHEAQGRGTLAVADFEKALRLDPRLKEAQLALQRLGILPAGCRGGDRGRRARPLARVRQGPAVRGDATTSSRASRSTSRCWARASRASWSGRSKTAPVRRHRRAALPSPGVVDSPRGPEEVEQVAIVDLQANAVLAVETHRRGTKLAQMTWDAGKLVLASADGTTEEFALRAEKSKELGRRSAQEGGGSAEGYVVALGEHLGFAARRPKTLFELLFGN